MNLSLRCSMIKRSVLILSKLFLKFSKQKFNFHLGAIDLHVGAIDCMLHVFKLLSNVSKYNRFACLCNRLLSIKFCYCFKVQSIYTHVKSISPWKYLNFLDVKTCAIYLHKGAINCMLNDFEKTVALLMPVHNIIS